MAPANNYMHMREIAASYTEAIEQPSLVPRPCAFVACSTKFAQPGYETGELIG